MVGSAGGWDSQLGHEFLECRDFMDGTVRIPWDVNPKWTNTSRNTENVVNSMVHIVSNSKTLDQTHISSACHSLPAHFDPPRCQALGGAGVS